MHTFNDPYTRAGDDVSLNAVREQVRLLENAHRANGISLSGRIVHVCHYLPVVPSLITHAPTPAAAGVLSPPATPPVVPGDVPPSPSDEAAAGHVQHDEVQQQPGQSRWKLAPRYGHAAMFSGIRALSTTHEQLIVGWTGDITAVPSAGTPSSEASSGEPVPCPQVTQTDRNALDAELVGYDEDGHGAHKIEYVPVWLEDKVAHGHYDGYCKMSESSLQISEIVYQYLPYSALAPLFCPPIASFVFLAISAMSAFAFASTSLPSFSVSDRASGHLPLSDRPLLFAGDGRSGRPVQWHFCLVISSTNTHYQLYGLFSTTCSGKTSPQSMRLQMPIIHSMSRYVVLPALCSW